MHALCLALDHALGVEPASRGVSRHRDGAGPLVVLGDSLLDVDLEGSSDRLCPDAPVPVVDVAREWQRPGGAGARRPARRPAPGHEVVLVTALGADESADRLRALLGGLVEVVALPLAGGTSRKTRVLGQRRPRDPARRRARPGRSTAPLPQAASRRPRPPPAPCSSPTTAAA